MEPSPNLSLGQGEELIPGSVDHARTSYIVTYSLD
jgi:hypothetical protein